MDSDGVDTEVGVVATSPLTLDGSCSASTLGGVTGSALFEGLVVGG